MRVLPVVSVLAAGVTSVVSAGSLESVHRLRTVQSDYKSLGARQEAPAPLKFNQTKDDFHVDGAKIPLLNETVQDSYAGVLPLTNQANESRAIFFWYWPSSAQQESASIAIWLNGGPGCSSLIGFLNEHGAFLVNPQPGDLQLFANKHAWSTAADVLYVDQPVGVGFSPGSSDIKNEDDVARDFYLFLQQFYSVFPEVLKKKLYLTGESYAGYYVPYIAQRIIKASDEEKTALPINLQGLQLNDGVYSDFRIGQYAPIADFIEVHQESLGLNDTEVARVRAASEECGFDSLMDKLAYPPKGPIGIDNSTGSLDSECFAVVNGAYDAAAEVNPCFNPGRISTNCPGSTDRTADYFAREDVRQALHVGTKWSRCVANILRDEDGNIVDPSPFTDTLFPGLIAALPRGVTLWHGLDDMLLIANGTRLTIQGMTWGGKQGFQTEPSKPIVFENKTRGLQHSERGLTYYEIANAGHKIPTDQPELALEVFKTVIGKGSLDHTNGNSSDSATGGRDDGTGAGSVLTVSMLSVTASVIIALIL